MMRVSLHQGKPLTGSDVNGEWVIRNPSNLEQELAKASYAYSHIGVVVQNLTDELQGWSQKPFEHRRAVLTKVLDEVLSHSKEWREIAQLELGRTPVDIEAEWKQFQNWSAHFKTTLSLQEHETRQARGLVAVVGSYVWPLVYSFQSVFLALLAGNAVVLKPSERATLASLAVGEWISSHSELKDLFSVILGDRELSRRLICHELVRAVVFYGSFEVGMRVRQDTLPHPSKEVLLFLGAKNPSIVLEDAPQNTVEALITDAFLSTGQHCRSVSQVWVQAPIFDQFLKQFHAASKLFKIADPTAGAFAGPLIDPAMVDRYLKFTGISEREGAEILMRGKPLATEKKCNFVTPTLAVFEKINLDQVRKSVSLQTEILSPHVSVLKFNEVDEVKQWSKEMTHGLVASIWSQDTHKAQALGRELPFGQIAVNHSLMSWDPARSFQVYKKSGNHAYHGSKLLEQLTILRA